MVKNVEHDSRDSKRGDFYQSLVAIKYALKENYQNFQSLTIEHEGDVTLDNVLQIETKHHIKPKSLADTSDEFWKTLYNWIRQPSSFEKYILYTTCHFPGSKNSLLKKFNSTTTGKQRVALIKKVKFGFTEKNITDFVFSKINIEIIKNLGVDEGNADKLSKIKGKKGKKEVIAILEEIGTSKEDEKIILKHCKATNSEEYKIWNYFRYTNSCSPDKLENILSKVELQVNQANDIKLIKILAETPVFRGKCKTENDIQYVIRERVAGSIASLVASEKRWEVSNVKFYNIINDALLKFFNETYRLSFDKYLREKPVDEDIQPYCDAKFVGELNRISCKDAEVKVALVDFWKTSKVLDEELDLNPTFVIDEYESYKEDVIYRTLHQKKIRLDRDVDDEVNVIKSRDFYRDVKEIQFQDSGKIKSYPYFSHGTMHNIVEDESYDFKWLIDD